MVNKLREYRQKRKLTLGQVALKTNIDKSYLSKIENGHRMPRYDKMRELSKLFRCSVDDLFSGK